jgi:uncharacterized CHY-type Zn-finger protein
MGVTASTQQSKGGDDTQDYTTCAKCGEDLNEGKYTVALSKAYHVECFTCAKCDNSLVDEEFFDVNGEPYCLADYSQHIAPACAACLKPVVSGRMFTTRNSKLHEECFSCTVCHRQLEENEQFYSEKRAVPGDEMAAKVARKARRAKRKARKNKRRGANATTEQDNDGDDDDNDTTDNKENKNDGAMQSEVRVVLYCRSCNLKERETAEGEHRCGWCDQIVEGNGIYACKQRWHEECFVCTDCETPLLDLDDFFELDGKLFCRQKECVFRDHLPEDVDPSRKRKRSLFDILTTPFSRNTRSRVDTASE